MSERLDWELMGRLIGTATGWDQHDTWIMMLYDFEPLEGLALPSGDVTFDFERGTATTYNDDGVATDVVDFLDAISHLGNVNL